MDLKEELKEKNYSIVSSNGYCSYDKGIRPVLVPMVEDVAFFKDQDIADKVIGKASAMLLVLSGVRRVDALLMSEAGKETLEKYGVAYSYETMVDYITNNAGDGMCPMEMTVQDIDDPKEAFEALRVKLSI